MDQRDTVVEGLLCQQQVGVGVCDASGRMTAFNPRMEALAGPMSTRSPEAWSTDYGAFDASGTHPLATDELPLVRALRGETVAEQVIVLRPPGQEPSRLRCTAFPLTDGDGRPGGAVVLVSLADGDAAQQRFEAARVEYQRRMGRIFRFTHHLTAVVDHQIRTPLAVLRGHVELLEDDGVDAAAVHRALPAMSRAVDALVATVEAFSRIDEVAAATAPELAAVDLVEVARDALAMVAGRPGDARARLTAASAPRVPTTADPVWVSRAVAALVEVVAASTAADVLVHVADGAAGVQGADDVVSVRVLPAPAADVCLAEGGPGRTDTLPANPRGLGTTVAEAVALAHGGELRVDDTPHGVVTELRLHREPASLLGG